MIPPPTNPAPATAGAARAMLTSIVVVCSVAISAGAAWVSFLAVRDLAILFGWSPSTAWIVMPLIELFLVVGSAEAALRVLDGEPATGPYAAAYSALIATLACNITDHVLRLIDTAPDVARWRVLVLGAFAALVPTAQIGALRFLAERLRRIAQARAARPGDSAPRPSLMGAIARAAGQRVLDRVSAPPAAPEPDAPTNPAPDSGRDAAPASQTEHAPPAPAEPVTSGAPRAPRNGGADRAAAWTLYVARVDEGAEPAHDEMAAALRCSAGHARKVRADLRRRYASEILDGTRAAPSVLPREIGALLTDAQPSARARVPEARTAPPEARPSAPEPAPRVTAPAPRTLWDAHEHASHPTRDTREMVSAR